jgi:hypothetical protein
VDQNQLFVSGHQQAFAHRLRLPPLLRRLLLVSEIRHLDKTVPPLNRNIDVICINFNKRFKSMRSVSMHLRMTATRHAVNFVNYGNYDNKTGLRRNELL